MSNSTYNYNHHIFLSFRGEDTRTTFISHLYKQLNSKGIQIFKDDINIQRGNSIPDTLLQAIEHSRACIVVLSRNYASSSWCLDELVKIMECGGESKGLIVLPVFYGVDPEDLKMGSGFGEGFERERVEKWREALVKVVSTAGWDSRLWSDSDLVDEIVEDVLKKLNRVSTPISNSMGLVGIDKQIEKVKSLLCVDALDVRIVGIWGMGGIGKTTIARIVFDHFRNLFEGSYFLADFKKKLEKDSVFDLQSNLVTSLLDDNAINSNRLSLGHAFVKDRLLLKRVLIVVDEVDSAIQLQELLPVPGVSFCPESRILITSRDKQVLKSVTNIIYEVEKLNHHEALELFSLEAFKKHSPKKDYLELSKRVVIFAKGNPLALKVSGCALLDRSKEVWESAMRKLREVLDPRIHDVLRISYDGLDQNQKQIFLDIACFYRGMSQDNVMAILGGSYPSVEYDIHVLIDKSLLTIYHNNFVMHDLIQEMGRSIVRAESKLREKRSRLWDHEDIRYVLTKKRKKGNEAVEGIFLDLFATKEMHLESNVFDSMDNLRLLKFYFSRFSGSYENKVHLLHHSLDFLPNELRYLHWDGFPSKCLPVDFCAENLVELILRNSKTEQLWHGAQNMVNLKSMDLSYSENLIDIPDLSTAKNIKSIYLESCTRLVEIPCSLQHLQKLEILYLDNCKDLTNLPARIDSKFLRILSLYRCKKIKECPELSGNLTELCLIQTAIVEVPKSFQHLKFVGSFSLGGCSMMIKFPEVPLTTENLSLTFAAIKEVPSSIRFLTSLVTLDLRGCSKLSTLPSDIYNLRSLQRLYLVGCSELKSFPTILEPFSLSADPLSSLKYLKLNGCRKFVSFPESIKNFSRLQFLDASFTKGLWLLPLKGLTCLRCLRLDYCGLLDLPSGLFSSLLSLHFLSLAGNCFQNMPADIINLTKLNQLCISRCQYLRSLPSLPLSLQYLYADNCTAMETLLLNESYNFNYFGFVNCLKLDQQARGILVDVLETVVKVCSQRRIFLFPGSDVPVWFDYQSMGSSVTIQLPSIWNQCKGIVMCLVFATNEFPKSVPRFSCKCSIKACDFQLNLHEPTYPGPINLIEFDHVAVWSCSVSDSNRARGWHIEDESCTEATFEFDIKPGPWEVKKCGFLLVSSDEQEISDDDDEEFNLFE